VTRRQADAVFVTAVFVLLVLFREAESRGYERGLRGEADRVASEALGG
jgi:hypothetical protein